MTSMSACGNSAGSDVADCIQLEVARVEQRSLAVLGQQHGRAQQCPAGMRGQPQAAEFDRLAIRHFQHAMLRPEPMPIQARRAAGRQCQFVPGDVIGVRVRHKAPRLPPAHVDAQLGQRQK